MYILLKSCYLKTNVDLVEFQKCLSIIIRFVKQVLTYGIKAAWISHGLGLIWVLADAISKFARLWNNYLQTTSQLLYKKSFHKQFYKLNFLLASTINSKLHLWDCTTTIWLPARWAPGFSGDHQQMQTCLCRLNLYIVSHWCCDTLFLLCWE